MITLKCPKCGIELLGQMEKCPKCGFVIPKNKIVACEGKFSENGGKWKNYIIQIVNDQTLRVMKSPNKSFGRQLSRSTFGIVGALAYDTLHEEEYSTPVFEVGLEKIVNIKRADNPSFLMGWSANLSDGRVIYLMLNQPVIDSMRRLLGARWK